MNDLTDHEIAQIIIEVIERRVGIQDLTVPCRTRRVAHARFLAARLIRELTDFSHADSADELGWEDHTGAVYAIKQSGKPRVQRLYDTVFHDLQTVYGLSTC